MLDIFAAVDMAGVATFVGATGVLLIGIYMAFRSINIAKNAIYRCSPEYRAFKEKYRHLNED